MTVCVVSGQLAEEITPVNATISTQAGSAKGQQSHSRCPYVLYQYYLSILASSPGPSHILSRCREEKSGESLGSKLHHELEMVDSVSA